MSIWQWLCQYGIGGEKCSWMLYSMSHFTPAGKNYTAGSKMTLKDHVFGARSGKTLGCQYAVLRDSTLSSLFAWILFIRKRMVIESPS